MKTKVYNLLNKFEMLLIIIVIVTFNLIVGGNEKALQILPIGIFTELSLLMLFIKKFIYKEKLIKSKIDVAVMCFMGTLILPLIFNTYCSLQGTVEFIIKYFFIFTMYLLIRNAVDSKKKVNILIASTVFSSIIIVILGIDLQHEQYCKWLIDSLDLWYGVDYRLTSTFGYANAVSIYIAFCVFLSIYRIENSKKWITKIIYGAYVIFGTYVVYISYSRVVLIAYAILLFAYYFAKIIIKIKDNQKLLIRVFSIICAIIIVFTIYLIIAMQISTPCDAKQIFKFRREFKKNQEYTFTFDVDIVSDETDASCPQLIMYEVNEYSIETEIGRMPLSRKTNINQIKIKTSDDLYYLSFTVLNTTNKKVTINHCYINGVEYIFAYKYVPRPISRLLKSLSFKDESIVQRIQFYENSLRIAKDSPIIGHGGNTWKVLSLAYEDDTFAVKETHSYFFELLISYGIIGVTAFTIILVFLCRFFAKQTKEAKKEKCILFIGLLMLIMYNYVFDFGFSFIVIILVAFAYIAALQYDNKEEIKIKLLDYISLILIAIIAIILMLANIAKYIVKDNSIKSNLAFYNADYKFENLKENNSDNLEYYKRFISEEPYYAQNYVYEQYWNAIFGNIKKYSDDEIKSYIDFGIETFNKIKCKAQVYFSSVFDRVYIMKDIVNKLKAIGYPEKAEQIKEIMLKEYYLNADFIKDYKRNNRTKADSESAIKQYKDILNLVNISVD